MRVLVAEDERVTRATLVRQLSAWGHEVVACEDGEGAWEAFESGVGGRPFDVVLTDWDMPRLPGVELVRRVRGAALARPGYVYVIMLTGRSDKSDVVSGIEAGADDYLAKPFDRGELKARLLAGERVVRLERALVERNAALEAATERLRYDLRAAARVQRAMLPKGSVSTERVRASWAYVPTDELAGDAIGLELVGGRYLVSYVVDVSGHGVPAALLSVTAMHALSPVMGGAGADASAGAWSPPSPSGVLAGLNARFCATDNDGRFLTMVLSVLDTHTGELTYARAAHPLPILLRRGHQAVLDDAGGAPVAMVDPMEYPDVRVRLEPGDRFVAYSDGIIEQLGGAGGNEQFGVPRLEVLTAERAGLSGPEYLASVVESLRAWAGAGAAGGGAGFADDVSIVCVDWLG